ncbi:MAG: hypothetical protein JSS83_12250 [Cyanobacteria bacterium SZAS LIN-3]|nr:hypothetical protein [Cyanobacteria bacterium SZAS LIN-3]
MTNNRLPLLATLLLTILNIFLSQALWPGSDTAAWLNGLRSILWLALGLALASALVHRLPEDLVPPEVAKVISRSAAACALGTAFMAIIARAVATTSHTPLALPHFIEEAGPLIMVLNGIAVVALGLIITLNRTNRG